jgi:hypothetical protein
MVLPKGGRVGRRQLHIAQAQSVMIGPLSFIYYSLTDT